MKRKLALGLLLALCTLTSHAVEVADGWMRALPPGQPTAAAYLTLRNPSATPVYLVGASSPSAGRVEMHRSTQVDGMWRMRELHRLEIPAGEAVLLAPGGTHLMMLDLNAPLRAGDVVTVELRFDTGESLPARVLVKAPGAGFHHHH